MALGMDTPRSSTAFWIVDSSDHDRIIIIMIIIIIIMGR
jgi:hypothetical protein